MYRIKDKSSMSMSNKCSTRRFEYQQFMLGIGLILIAMIFSNISRADSFSITRIKNLVAEHAKTTRHIDPALGLAVARVMSNFDAEAIGPAQRIGLFQLDPQRIGGVHQKRDLLDPVLNTRIGLNRLDQLIDSNNGDVAMALVEFNDGNELGPWPSSRVVKYPGGLVANIFAAKKVFEQKLSSKHVSYATPIIVPLFETATEDDIYPLYGASSELPRWRNKINATRYWLDEIERIKRAMQFESKLLNG